MQESPPPTSPNDENETNPAESQPTVAPKKNKIAPVESSFRLLVESVRDYAIFMLDPTGRVATWNIGAERINGYKADEILGVHFSRFYPPEDLAWGKPDWELEQAQLYGRFEDEGWRLRNDGSRFWANVIITALIDQDGELKGFAKVTRDMTERRQTEQRIRHTNAALEKRVRERTADLEAANREKDELLRREREARLLAEKAYKEREQFLSGAAHELKTPLTSLLGFTQVIKRQLEKGEQLNPERLHYIINVMEAQSNKLNQLIMRMLDISQFQSGNLVLAPEKVDLVQLVKNAAENAQGITAAHKLKYILPDSLIASVDHSRFEQVVNNLVENAVKYSPEGGSIELKLSLENPEMVRFAVQDWGLGIDFADREHIFEPFFQGSQAQFAGLGLGLYISRQIVELHGGAIRVEFPEEGGTRFVIEIPRPLD